MSQRDSLFWRIVFHAATRPRNVAALIAGIVLAALTTPLVLLGAVPVYGLLVAGTIRSPREAARLAARAAPPLLEAPARRDLAGLTGELRREVVAALSQEAGIMKELDRAPLAPDGVRDQVRGLCDELVAAGRRGSEIELYLRTVDVPALERRARPETAAGSDDVAEATREQLALVRDLQARRDVLAAEALCTQATLGAIRARLVAARAQASEPLDVRTDLAALRDRLRAMTAALDESRGQNADVHTGKGT